jgi:hypothetical protein
MCLQNITNKQLMKRLLQSSKNNFTVENVPYRTLYPEAERSECLSRFAPLCFVICFAHVHKGENGNAETEKKIFFVFFFSPSHVCSNCSVIMIMFCSL